MRAYLPISHVNLAQFVVAQSHEASRVFAPTSEFIDENVDCDQEEIEYLLSVLAAEVALEIRATKPNMVKPIKIPFH